MTVTDIQNVFKFFGKLVYTYNDLAATKLEFPQAVAAPVHQMCQGQADEVPAYTNLLKPYLTRVNAIDGNMASLQTLCAGTVTTYLQQILASKVGLTSSDTPARILTALAAAMTAAAPVQKLASTSLFIAFFTSQLGFTGFPNTATPGDVTIPDTWVSDTPS